MLRPPSRSLGLPSLLALLLVGGALVVGCNKQSPIEISDVAEQSKGDHRPLVLAQADPAAVPGGDQVAADGAPPRSDQAAPARSGAAQPPIEDPFPRRSPSPSLDGGVAWINVAGPIDLKDLRGKFVVLDFWTFCCINCMHVLPELKKLEKAYPHNVVVIGVHSAKFESEQDSQNITDAVLRYEIEHPVINDSDHKLWDKFNVNSWPSLRIIDPDGNLVAGHSGEIEFDTLDRFMKSVLPYYRQKGTLDETPVRFDLETRKVQPTPLRFPGKILADEPSGRLFIADSNHNRVVVTKLDGTLLTTIGSGALGAADGDFASAQFDHPQGMALKDETLYVADTENHLLRKVDLKAKRVTTIAGVGHQARGPWPGMESDDANGPARAPDRFVGPPLKTALNSPWDLFIDKHNLYIAMAGSHQIWKMPLDESEIGPYAGNGREDIVDGPLLPRAAYDLGWCSFAQPSGLTSDGKWLYVADSEGSSIRAVPLDGLKEVRTVIGTANLRSGRLFTFGDTDGQGADVRLQHCLGVVYHAGKIYVADTYNNKIKVVDPDKATSNTIAGTGKAGHADSPASFEEPTGLSYAAGKLYVADTNSNLIRTIDLEHGNVVATLSIPGLEPPPVPKPDTKPNFKNATKVPVAAAKLKAVDGAVHLTVKLVLPTGYKINPLAPMRYLPEAAGEAGPLDRASLGKLVTLDKPAAQFDITLPLKQQTGSDEVTISMNYYYCQDGAEGVCKAGSVSWRVPITVDAQGQAQAVLEYQVK